jgi:inorganic phosphate transporter, PiT family
LLGFPISTTHGLTGALVGAGLVAAGSQLNISVLGSTFVLPLLVSPVLAVLLTMPLYKGLHALTGKLGVTRQSCVCIAPGKFAPVGCGNTASASATMAAIIPSLSVPQLVTGNAQTCVDKYNGKFIGFNAQGLVDSLHYASAAAVSFARGLNDTPKIVGLLLVVKALDLKISMLTIAIAMAVGGLLNARKVAHTMAKKISVMNDGQALTANMVTAFMVIAASRLGVPVSTTHVSVGAITGVGLINGSADKRVVGNILASWVLTLPIAAAISAGVYYALTLSN